MTLLPLLWGKVLTSTTKKHSGSANLCQRKQYHASIANHIFILHLKVFDCCLCWENCDVSWEHSRYL